MKANHPKATPKVNLLMRLPPEQRNLTIAFLVSLLLHGLALSIHFKLPSIAARSAEKALDVILVNSKSAQRPTEAQAKAQAHLDGGGNTDENRRAKTPLPPNASLKPGRDFLLEAKRRVAELEAQQRQLLTQLAAQAQVKPGERQEQAVEPSPNTPSGRDLAEQALAIARLEGEIARNAEEYNRRPRRKNIGARTEEYRFAQYVEDWRQKVERIGNLNYPEAARGRIYGRLMLTVKIRSDGSLEGVDLDRSSGQPVLDEAALRIVYLAAPYAPFPDNIRRDTDIIEITRWWSFTSGDKVKAD